MKNKILLSAMLIGVAGVFTACSDDNDSNPTLIQPTVFVLNSPAYINETIDLATTDALTLSWSQPKYTADNAPINATYEVQVSPTNSFTVSTDEAEADESGAKVADYSIIDKTSTTCVTDVAAEDIAKALIKVTKWDESSVPTTQDAYIRVNAYIAESTKKLNPIASNVIKLEVNPCYIELKNASPIMWYMVGSNLTNATADPATAGAWGTNNVGTPGADCYPMFLVPGFTYDKKTGAGEVTYLNYFTTDSYKIQPSNFDWNYGLCGNGANNLIYRNGEEKDPGNAWMDPAGYYLVTVNTGDNTAKIEKQNITPTVYDQICITGSFSSWADRNMTPANFSGENHVWYYTLEVEAGTTAQIKFKIPASGDSDGWSTNWGFGSADGEVNVCGKGTNGGKNIGVAEGTWIIGFNDITGEFSIIAKQTLKK